MQITYDDLLNFLEKLVKQIPKGKITTYKELALALGSIYATRFIFQNVKKIDGPWWRVVNEKGEIKDPEQKKRLEEEGILIKNNKIDINRYLFKEFVIQEKPLEKLRQIQRELTNKIILEDKFEKIDLIGGVDLSYKNDIAKVVYVLLDTNLKLVKYYIFEEKVDFPYIPTFLAFREGDPIIKTFNRIEKPDILFVNGQGIAHPVKLGLATYVGVLLDIPTIGVTRRHLYGKIIENRIYDENKNLIGYVLEKFGKKVYVSPGNKVSVNTAKDLSDMFWIRGNYPEPIRLADEISKRVRNKNLSIKDFI